MAGDWIKMRGNLWDDPRVASLCDITGASEATVIGGLYWLWSTADQHTEDGCMPGLTLRAIDRKTDIQGLGAALVQIGWLAEEARGVVLCRFGEHNGASAKRRCLEAKRQANVRTQCVRNADAMHTGRVPREEKRREEEYIPCANAQGVASTAADAQEPAVEVVPKQLDCPHERIIAAYHEVLPMCPQVREWHETRRGYLRQRWREKAESERWDTEDAGVQWFRAFFQYVRASKFLTGQQKAANDRRVFVADLEWLIRPNNFAKVVEGRYEE